MHTAVLLIAHGSRVAAANDDLRQLAVLLAARRPELVVERAYLELAEPTIPQGMRRCVERGASEVRMLPFFLSPGAHVTRDLRAYREQFGREYPGVVCRLCPPLGLHPLLVEVLLERLTQAE
jgi:sirohydrochlorin ferrochelatase